MMELPIPPHFDESKIATVYRVDYAARAADARQWAYEQHVSPAVNDRFNVGLIIIDYQNTFCLPEFELFVAGRSGHGATADSLRLCRFIYRNLSRLSRIYATLDTHQAMQIFHPIFFIDARGNYPAPMTQISVEDVEQGRWQVNPAIAESVSPWDAKTLQTYLLHYCRKLRENGKYTLMVWPYHAMLGGVGYALVSAVEEALFFHSIARQTQTIFEVKGNNPLTENYSALKPEVFTDHAGNVIAQENPTLIDELLEHDALIITGQAKSHCVAWTIEDLIEDIGERDKNLLEKIYVLEDCTSPVVVPGVVDFTDEAEKAFERFRRAGVNIVRSADPMSSWPKLDQHRESSSS